MGVRFVRLDEPQELSVPLSDLPGAVHTDVVAVVKPDLCHDTSLGPLFGIVPVLLLDQDVISVMKKWWYWWRLWSFLLSRTGM